MDASPPPDDGLLRRWFAFVIDHRALVMGVCLAISVVAALSTSRLIVASSVGGLFLGNSPAYAEYQRLAKDFGNDEIVAVAWEDDAPLSDSSLDRLERAAEALGALPYVGRVDSVIGAPRVVRDGDGILVQSWAEAARALPETERGDLLRALQSDPTWGGLLVGRDGSAAALVVELRNDPDRAAEAVPPILAEIEARMVSAGFAAEALHPVGLPVQIGGVIAQTLLILGTIFPFVIALLLGTVWLLFGRLWPAMISTSIAGLGVLWTMGLAIELDRHVNVLFAIVPAVIMIVAFSDVVHLCSAYLLELDAGRSKRDAILASAEDVGRACLYTSATTFVGFVSLALIPTPVFQHLGVVLGCGVAIALLQAVTLTPLLFSFLPPPPPMRQGGAGQAHDLLDRLLAACERLALGRPRTVVAAFTVVGVVLLFGASRITFETDFGARLSPSHPVRVDQAFFLERFAGTNVLDIYVDSGRDDGLLDPAQLAGLARLHDGLAGRPEVEQASSIVSLLREVHAALAPDDADALPTTRAGIAQHLLLFEGGGGELERMLDFPRRKTRLSLRLRDEGFRGTAEVGRAALELAAEVMPDATVTPSGLSYLLGDWLDEILAGQRNSLLASLLLIAVMMAMAVRSWGMGLASMAPNLLPLIAYGGALGFLFDTVDSDALIVAVLALGVGVDDTIHFLVRYRVERSRGLDREAALRRTFAFAGRAIVMTTVILVVGFLPFAATGYYTTRLLGTYLPLCLIVAVVADLLLVPAMIASGLGLDFGGPGRPASAKEAQSAEASTNV